MKPSNFPPSKQHTGIWGKTGSGKSAFSTFLHNEVPHRSIFFNYENKPRDEYKPEGLKIDRNTPKSKIRKALRSGNKDYHKLVYECHYKPEIMDKELNELFETIMNINPIIYLFIDEAHEFGDSILRIIRKGDGYKIRAGLISQRPKDVGTDINSNIEDHVFFKLKEQQQYYINQYFDYDKIVGWTKKDYHFVMSERGQTYQQFKPIPLDKIK